MSLSKQQERHYRTKRLCMYFMTHGTLYPPYWEEGEREAILQALEADGLPRPEEELPKKPWIVCSATEGLYSEPADLMEYREEEPPIQAAQAVQAEQAEETAAFEYAYEAVERRIERLEQLFKLEGLL